MTINMLTQDRGSVACPRPCSVRPVVNDLGVCQIQSGTPKNLDFPTTPVWGNWRAKPGSPRVLTATEPPSSSAITPPAVPSRVWKHSASSSLDEKWMSFRNPIVSMGMRFRDWEYQARLGGCMVELRSNNKRGACTSAHGIKVLSPMDS